jgi:hypothetical protein
MGVSNHPCDPRLPELMVEAKGAETGDGGSIGSDTVSGR